MFDIGVGPKWGAILDFLTSILLQNIKHIEGGPYADIEKFA